MEKMIDITERVAAQRRYFGTGVTRTRTFRMDALRRLERMIRQNSEALCEALYKDLHKSPQESYLTELGMVLQEIRYHIRHLKRWMKGQCVPTPLIIQPARSRIMPEPLGVVLIIAPWNYPVQLLLNPLVGAISAGNCALLKSSPLIPHTETLLEKLIANTFDPEYVALIPGDAQVVGDLLVEKFDHIFFTGGSTFGEVVMRAAAKHLTPVTLELGGKSPCIVGRDVPIKQTARRIIWGKLLNAGQTCIAPDYLFVHADRKEELCTEMEQAIRSFYGDDPLHCAHYPRIVTEQATQRLEQLMGASGRIIYGGTCDLKLRYVAPTLIDNPDDDSPIMQQEIFGPLLPVKTFERIDTVIDYINSREKPLALYYFGSKKESDRILQNTSSGGVCINDTLVHIANHRLPFGGVGRSGIGKYHGRLTFELFSNLRAVVRSASWIDIPLKYPPYLNQRLLKRFF